MLPLFVLSLTGAQLWHITPFNNLSLFSPGTWHWWGVREEQRRSEWIIKESVSALRERWRWMEGGLKESEESCRITILLHSAHPPRSSLSVSLYNLKTQTDRRSHRQNLRYSRGHVSQTKKKKQKETLSPASSVGLCVAAALLSNILPFYFSSNVKLSLLTSRIIMAAVCCCALSTVQYIS